MTRKKYSRGVEALIREYERPKNAKYLRDKPYRKERRRASDSVELCPVCKKHPNHCTCRDEEEAGF